jgi:hypothetical protein
LATASGTTAGAVVAVTGRFTVAAIATALAAGAGAGRDDDWVGAHAVRPASMPVAKRRDQHTLENGRHRIVLIMTPGRRSRKGREQSI